MADAAGVDGAGADADADAGDGAVTSPPPSVNFFNTEAGVAVLGSVVSALVLSFFLYIQRRGLNARDVVAV